MKKDYVVKLVNDKKLIYWRIEDPKTGMVIVDQDQNISWNDSAEILREALDQLTGVQRVILRKDPFPNTTGRRTKTEEYTTLVNCTEIGKGTTTGTGGIDINTFLGLNQKNLELQMEIFKADLERQNDKSDLMEALAKKVIETPAIMEGIGNVLNSFAGIKKAAVNIDPVITGAKVTIKPETINRLAAADPDLINTLDLLALWMEKNPGQIELIKQTIKANT